MGDSMNFQSVNILNDRLNKISGNLLPMTSNSSFSIFWQVYGILVWLELIVRAGAFIPGIMFVSRERVMANATTSIVYTTEVIFLNVQIQRHSKLLRQFILELNDILSTKDEIMKDLVTTITKPIKTVFTLYCIISVLSLSVCYIMTPLMLVFKKSSFYYEDYIIPVAFSAEPFSAKVYMLGSLVLSIGSIYMFLKKAGVDIYMIHLVMLMTVQYRYITTKLAMIFRESDMRHERDDFAEGCYPRTNSWTEKELKALCRHHNAIVHLSFLLKKLLSLNFNLIYVISVFRFCFGAIIFKAMLSASFLGGFLIFLFVLAAVLQFYILCYSIQKLLDASTELTDMAFQENWYKFGLSIKRIFMLMILSNNLECKLTTCEKLNLSLP
ncbi:odorant receptor 49a-like [Odontomachus brunneus]|uniref:odorant receptor 49a-like n=1 Tax=Odontomachus brunneus TaxID=486640 RepID=UPI0013F22053|nr:odorant receptor 49a-like [Odontomachus brunneus]